MNTVLVTGGAGFIGSHTVVELCKRDYEVVIVDNLVNSRIEVLRRIEKLVGRAVPYYRVNLLDEEALEEVFKKHRFDYVIHFAALKAVGESIERPIRYYKNNLIGALNLLEIMTRHGVSNFVFSSSATVYGHPEYLPIDEAHPAGSCTNPYGRSKFFIEEMARDVQKAYPAMNMVILRYFNPCGAHESGEIGEDPNGVPSNLMPFLAQVAVGRRPFVTVFGDDYDTPDGTAVRDYVHVVDLALGHVAALNKMRQNSTVTGTESTREKHENDSNASETIGTKNGETCVLNLAAGHGYSILQMIAAMERASGRPVPYKIAARRPGDCARLYGDVKLAANQLGWEATRGLDEICRDLWTFISKNPNGYNAPSSAIDDGVPDKVGS